MAMITYCNNVPASSRIESKIIFREGSSVNCYAVQVFRNFLQQRIAISIIIERIEILDKHVSFRKKK